MAGDFETQGVKISLMDAEEVANSLRTPSPDLQQNEDHAYLSDPPPKDSTKRRICKSRVRKLRVGTASQASILPLRPAKDILSRIRHDPSLNEDDFVIGYRDRHLADVVEIDVSAWKGGGDVTDEHWVPQHRILYFRKKDDGGTKMWDRARRIDRIFGSGDPEYEEGNVVRECIHGEREDQGSFSEGEKPADTEIAKS